jgi:hypothetical protein
MDQLVIANFKKQYMKLLFNHLFERCELYDNSSVYDFWKIQFTIVTCIALIARAWKAVTQKTLNSAWRALAPNFCQQVSGNDPGDDGPEVIADILATAGSMDMEVSEEEVLRMVEEDVEDLTVDDLEEMARQGEEEEGPEEAAASTIGSSVIKEMLQSWSKFRDWISAEHPEHLEVEEAADRMDAYAEHFRAMLKGRQRQSNIHQFFGGAAPPAHAPAASGAGPSGLQAPPQADPPAADSDTDDSG